MAFLFNLHLGSVAVLMLAFHLEFASAAVRISGLQARSLSGDPSPNPPDPYVKVWCGSSYGGMTDFQRDKSNPVWNAEFNFPNCGVGDRLKLEVWDKDLNFDDHLFTCTRRVERGSHDASCTSSGTLYFTYRAS